ncbi:hypothetical protein NIES2119_18450 [[Phormidium ambiguum] IAM M-71]|uniref:CopG family transcriptional regulator n=2 Tax=[Phormidium ambiguum] IAM M-71 TaxID=454136 RepID=A0A1U7IFZ0_9CYAN|nr:hypothetical protein NIES2119_18450 [Phormidium ambiguum IAM M-71]
MGKERSLFSQNFWQNQSEATMQITLSQEQTQILEALVKQGQYSSVEEAINTALQLLIHDVAEREAWLRFSRNQLNDAYTQDDDYPLDAIKIANPDYAGS